MNKNYTEISFSVNPTISSDSLGTEPIGRPSGVSVLSVLKVVEADDSHTTTDPQGIRGEGHWLQPGMMPRCANWRNSTVPISPKPRLKGHISGEENAYPRVGSPLPQEPNLN